MNVLAILLSIHCLFLRKSLFFLRKGKKSMFFLAVPSFWGCFVCGCAANVFARVVTIFMWTRHNDLPDLHVTEGHAPQACLVVLTLLRAPRAEKSALSRFGAWNRGKVHLCFQWHLPDSTMDPWFPQGPNVRPSWTSCETQIMPLPGAIPYTSTHVCVLLNSALVMQSQSSLFPSLSPLTSTFSTPCYYTPRLRSLLRVVSKSSSYGLSTHRLGRPVEDTEKGGLCTAGW